MRMGRQRIPGDDPGKWNEAKGKVLLLLYLRARKLGNNRISAITVSKIHELTGVAYRTLLTSLPKWHRWEYIRRYRIPLKKLGYKTQGRYVFGYSIALKGIDWIEEWACIFLPFSRYRDRLDRGMGLYLLTF
jgi:hypothetical protein